MRRCSPLVLLLLLVAPALVGVARGAFSAAHLRWAFLTHSVAGNDGGCGAALGKDVQRVHDGAEDAQVAVLDATYLYNDGVRCRTWVRYTDARWMTVSSKGDWQGDSLINVGTHARKLFGTHAVAWATAHSTDGADNLIVCGDRSISRVVFVRADGGDSGSLPFDGREVRVESGALYAFLEEGDGRLCAFSGWTDAPNKREGASLGGREKGTVRVRALAGGLAGVAALALVMYGATLVLFRRERLREADKPLPM